MGDNIPLAIGARLDRMPVTSFHHRLALIVAAGLLVDGVDVYMTAGISGALVQEGTVTLSQVGQLAMATSLGLMAGGALTGLLADWIGRLRSMWVTISFVIVGGFFAAVAPSFEYLLFWRAVTALGLGGDVVLAYGLITEFVPAGARGRWLAWVGLLGSFGLPLCLGIGRLVLPEPDGWRIMLAIPAVAAFGVLLLRLQLFESPRWLACRGREAEAEAIVARVEATSPRRVAPPHQESIESLEGDRVVAGFWPRLATASAIHIATMGAVFGFVSWLPTFFAASGQDIATSTLFAGLMATGAPVGTLLAMAVTDRIERKWGVVACALLAVAVGIPYAFATTTLDILIFGFAVVVSIYMLATLGLFSYVPELFPTRVRLRTIGLVVTLGRLTALAMPLAVVPLFSVWGQKGVIVLVSTLLLAQALIVAALGVHTRGRALELAS